MAVSSPSATALKRQLSRFEIKAVQGLNNPKKRSQGEGSYGSVYEVTVNGVPRIAKQLHSVLITADVRPDQKQGIYERFYKECLLMSGLDHPNIVKFVGVHFGSSDKEFDASLIMEKLDTDLDKYLKDRPNVPMYNKLSILLDVSIGLLYLHTQPEPIVHRDLTPGNVLLTKGLQAKIADFGVSRVLNISPNALAAQTKCPGTLAYMPPEALQEKPVYGKALDVFSFGEVCLCTIHQEFAEVFDVTNRPEMPAAHRQGVLEILKRKKWIDRLPRDHCLRKVVTSCLQDRPEKRPTTEQLKDRMTELCIEDWRKQDSLREALQELGDLKREVPQLKSALDRTQAELQQVSRHRDELVREIETYKLTAQTFKDDFKAERKDREQAHLRVSELEKRYTHQIQVLAEELQTKSKVDDNQVLLSELKEFKRGRGVASPQAPPTSPRVPEPNHGFRQQFMASYDNSRHGYENEGQPQVQQWLLQRNQMAKQQYRQQWDNQQQPHNVPRQPHNQQQVPSWQGEQQPQYQQPYQPYQPQWEGQPQQPVQWNPDQLPQEPQHQYHRPSEFPQHQHLLLNDGPKYINIGDQQRAPVPRPRKVADQAYQQPVPNYRKQPSQPAESQQPNLPRAPSPVAEYNPNDTRLLIQRDNLQENIDEEMSKAVAEVTATTTEERERKEAPLDPNLVCPMCMKQYRLGEIQPFRAHVGKCDGSGLLP